MKNIKNVDDVQERTVYELSKLLQELCFLKNQGTDEKLQRDYDIYIRDIQRFLVKASTEILSLEEIQVYIDDYQGVIKNAIVNHALE